MAKDKITAALLHELLARAWDEQDQNALQRLSAAADSLTLEQIEAEGQEYGAV